MSRNALGKIADLDAPGGFADGIGISGAGDIKIDKFRVITSVWLC